MKIIGDPIDRRLLDEWQRDLPICERPFAAIAMAIGTNEDDVVERLEKMRKAGRVSRIGATCAPNSVSASTLAAIAVPDKRIDHVAAIISAQEGVNHSYQREDTWNLWFVATGPDRAHVDATLANIGMLTGLRVLNLPLVRPFNVDLGFRMSSGKRGRIPAPRRVDLSVMQEGDRRLLQQLTSGLPIVARPYAALAARLRRPEAEVTGRIGTLLRAGIITRLGVIVRHRALGWSSNAMVVWDLPPHRIDTAGPALAALPGVTLCYERSPVPDVWPYRLYNMIHARSRNEALEVLDRARALPEMDGTPHKALFSTRCFKQTGALISLKTETPA
ncbi:MAG: AsnC family transcriptional regulator [Jhaorihella sp.]